MIILAHIKEQARLSLVTYGRPRMTEDLKGVGGNVGHRRVGRLVRDNGIVIERTRKFKVEEGQKMIRGVISPTTDR